MKKNLLLLFAALLPLVASAHDFEVDGLNYTILSSEDKTVSIARGNIEPTGDLYIPATVIYEEFEYRVIEIGNNAFENCTNLKSITISESVTLIGDYAFSGCTNLENYTNIFYSHLTDIGNCAFYNCSSLTSFYHLSVNSIRIGGEAFCGCSKLTYIKLEFIELIGGEAFCGCSNLENIDIAATSAVKIGANAFEGTAWYNNQPDGVVYFYNNLYKYKGEMPASAYIEIAEGTKTIANCAFSSCTNLTSVTIPKSITAILIGAFSGCANLTSIICKAVTPPSIIVGDPFNGVDKSIPVYVPASAVEAYKAAEYWNEFTNIIGMREVLASGTCGTNLTWTLYADGELIIEGTGEMNDYEQGKTPWYEHCDMIKDIVLLEGVTSIGNYAFYNCSSLTSITIPEGVTSIGITAFRGCCSLTSITIPESVTSIESYAFSGCSSLTAITIPEEVTSIGGYTFSGCSSLTSINIPNGVMYIGSYAFNDCSSLTSIIIPESVTAIGDHTFTGCSGLTSIIVEEGNEVYDSRNGCNAIIETNSNTLIRGCSTTIIPEGVTSIGNNAFLRCSSLTAITIPQSVTSIKHQGFRGCSSLTTITIPENSQLTSIGQNAFYDCSSLTAITIPKSVTSITSNAFRGCSSLEHVSINCSNVGRWFVGSTTSIKEIILGENVTSIGVNAFNGCSNLTTITSKATTPPTIGSSDTFNGVDKSIPVYVPASAVEAYKAAEYWGEFNNIIGVREVLASGTCGTNLTWTLYADGELIIEGTGEMNNYSWEDEAPWIGYATSIQTVSIKDGATSIGDEAFNNCSSLTSITLPEGVTSIGNSAFYNCSSLTLINLPEGVTWIGDRAFYGCSALTSITIPNGVKTIAEFGFGWCESLQRVDIPESMENIERAAFCGCLNLNTIVIDPKNTILDDCENNAIVEKETKTLLVGTTSGYIPEGIEVIGDYAFAVRNINDIIIPNSVVSIRDCAFVGSSIRSVHIPPSVKEIDYHAFGQPRSSSECNNLEAVYIEDLEAWFEIDFEYNEENPLRVAGNLYLNGELLESISVPEGITSIKKDALHGWNGKEIILPSSVTSIGNSAFSGCSSLATITCKAATPPTIGRSDTFNGVDKSIPVYVPAGSVEAYKAAEYWKEFTNIIGMTITTPTESFVVKIGSAGYATLYLYYAVECPRGVEAYYIIRVAGNVAVLKAIWGYIPANTGVILRGTAGTYTFAATSESVAAISENLLQGTTEDKEIRAQKNTTYYALGRVDGVVGLYRAELEDGYFFNNANKAYLALTSEAEGDDDGEQFSRGLSLRFPDGSTTSMDEVMDCDASEVEVIYDLQGRRLTEITEHGVYIVNGKKVWR